MGLQPYVWLTEFSANIFALSVVPSNQTRWRVGPGKGFPMARYFFHIKDGADLIKDQEARNSRRRMLPACKP